MSSGLSKSVIYNLLIYKSYIYIYIYIVLHRQDEVRRPTGSDEW